MPYAENAPTPDRWRPADVYPAVDDMNEFWQSPEGQRLHAAPKADEADLQSWLADQPGVVVHDHGGYAPEQWKGEVDGHSFYFRERDTEWDIEINLRPSGSMRVDDGTHDDGTTRYRQHQIIEGDVGATGPITAEGYDANPRERAAFIITTIRDRLRRKRVAKAARMIAERSAELNHRLSSGTSAWTTHTGSNGCPRTTNSLGSSPSSPRCPGWRPPLPRRCKHRRRRRTGCGGYGRCPQAACSDRPVERVSGR